MRIVLLFLILSLTACEGFFQVSDLSKKAKVDTSYQARESCLKKNAAADGTGSADSTTLAHAVAISCAPQTQALVEASNRDGDTRVSDAIRQDSEFRAMKYVLQARKQSAF
ncbi:hypothetical protein BH11PSE3_BH11PSE3_25470 [soil metagenome]